VSWYEEGYPGGTPVGPAKLPRALYPPANQAGKPESSPGPDVQAMKRAVSRLGRWPWQSFDQAYSRGFALGTSGNVKDSGVAGAAGHRPYRPGRRPDLPGAQVRKDSGGAASRRTACL